MTNQTTKTGSVEQLHASGYGFRFLGIGGPGAPLGPVAVAEKDGAPLLMIDCPPGALDAYRARYDAAPRDLYITHTHLDHVGGMEELFHGIIADAEKNPAQRIRVFAHAAIIPSLQDRLVCNKFIRAEGGVNFWDAFQLVPVSDGFWIGHSWFDVFESRHMQPSFCFGVALKGAFVYTGDTRPIPEVLASVADDGETIFHDCALRANPAHTGFVDLLSEYPADLLNRVVCYHYGSEAEGARLEAHGFRVARTGETLSIPCRGSQAAA
jgi:hypothetical protein